MRRQVIEMRVGYEGPRLPPPHVDGEVDGGSTGLASTFVERPLDPHQAGRRIRPGGTERIIRGAPAAEVSD